MSKNQKKLKKKLDAIKTLTLFRNKLETVFDIDGLWLFKKLFLASGMKMAADKAVSLQIRGLVFFLIMWLLRKVTCAEEYGAKE